MKIKNFLTPLLLLTLLCVLGGLAFWDDKKSEKDKVAEELKGKLFDFNPSEIVTIKVQNRSAEPNAWALQQSERGGKKVWAVSSPFAYPADSDGIDRLLKIILEAKAEREFEQGPRSLADFGLAPPQIVYELTDKGGKTWRFTIGGKNPTGYSSYAQRNDDPKIQLVNQYLFTATNKTLSDFRDKSLGLPDVLTIQSVTVNWPGQASVSLKKGASEKAWQVTEPFSGKADTADIDKWLSSWNSLRVTDFIDNPGPELLKALTNTGKGTREYARLHVETEKEKREIFILENNGKLYTKLSEITYAELDKESVDALKRNPKEFEDRSVFSFVSVDVKEVTIDSVRYIKDGENWVRASDKKAMPFVRAMIVSFEFAKADSKLDAKSAAALMKGPPVHTVDIQEGQKPKIQITLWRAADTAEGPAYILKNGDAYYRVNQEFVDLLTPRAGSMEPTLGGEQKGQKS